MRGQRRLNLVYSYSTFCYINLALEEYLLDRFEESFLLFYRNRPTVVIGRNQNPMRETRPGLLVDKGIRLARRISGGGAVYHDEGNLNFCYLTSKADFDRQFILMVLRDILSDFQVKCEISGNYDLLYEGKKFSGSAFALRKRRALHHGTLLINSDLEALRCYLAPQLKREESPGGVESRRSEVVNLASLNSRISYEGICRELGQRLGSGIYRDSLTRDSDELIDRKLYEPYFKKQTSPEWCPDTLSILKATSGGEIYKSGGEL